MWFDTHTEYYSTIKMHEALIHATIWMNHGHIMLSKRSQSQKTTYSMIPFIWNEMYRTGKSREAERK